MPPPRRGPQQPGFDIFRRGERVLDDPGAHRGARPAHQRDRLVFGGESAALGDEDAHRETGHHQCQPRQRRPGVRTPHTAAGSKIDTPTHTPTCTALTSRAEAAIAAPRAVMSVSSLSSSSVSSSLTGDTVSTGIPSRRANKSRPVIDPKCGGRTRATHSAIVGAILTSTSSPTSTQIASTCTETGRNIRTTATAARIPHTVTTAVDDRGLPPVLRHHANRDGAQ